MDNARRFRSSVTRLATEADTEGRHGGSAYLVLVGISIASVKFVVVKQKSKRSAMSSTVMEVLSCKYFSIRKPNSSNLNGEYNRN